LRLLYLISIDSGRDELVSLQMLPLRVRQLRLPHVSDADTAWLRATAEHTSKRFHIQVGGHAAGPAESAARRGASR
jgi:poly-gamma-glutamate synthesis protein (capsule biosynthesis protein)